MDTVGWHFSGEQSCKVQDARGIPTSVDKFPSKRSHEIAQSLQNLTPKWVKFLDIPETCGHEYAAHLQCVNQNLEELLRLLAHKYTAAAKAVPPPVESTRRASWKRTWTPDKEEGDTDEDEASYGHARSPSAIAESPTGNEDVEDDDARTRSTHLPPAAGKGVRKRRKLQPEHIKHHEWGNFKSDGEAKTQLSELAQRGWEHALPGYHDVASLEPLYEWLVRERGGKEIRGVAAAEFIWRAMAVGGRTAGRNYDRLRTHWRESGNPLAFPASSIVAAGRADCVPAGDNGDDAGARFRRAFEGFRRSYRQIGVAEAKTLWGIICYRGWLAETYRCYCFAGDLLPEDMRLGGYNVPEHRNRKQVGRIKWEMFRRLYGYAEGAELLLPRRSEAKDGRLSVDSGREGTEASQNAIAAAGPEAEDISKHWREFTKRLSQGKRWDQLRKEFGDAIFVAMPSSVIPNSWVERLCGSPFSIWIRMIRTFNPEAGIFCARILEDVRSHKEWGGDMGRLEDEG